ncbi:hypothetical protein [Bifidobacterium adolescentis]|uniref:hypothetical protein n=1 Tax=Bifidobacterium adolescentis TaxID=1680 RepID=UPI001897B0F9|nr:hypothetical protein [Bifidobacterium adolescentis]
MKSFALWCDAKNAGESTGVKVLMNFNLWAEAEKGESHTVLDVITSEFLRTFGFVLR